MSLVKYIHEREQGPNSTPLFWGRSDVDQAPFRGSASPLLRSDEFENLSDRVYDVHVEIFALKDVEAKRRVSDIMERAANGWYKITHIERQFVPEDKNWVVYLEWAEPYMEQRRNSFAVEPPQP